MGGRFGGRGVPERNRATADLIDMGRWSVRLGVFSSVFSRLFPTWFLKGFFLDFGGVLEPKIGPQTCFWAVFCDPFFEGILESIFSLFFRFFLKCEP